MILLQEGKDSKRDSVQVMLRWTLLWNFSSTNREWWKLTCIIISNATLLVTWCVVTSITYSTSQQEVTVRSTHIRAAVRGTTVSSCGPRWRGECRLEPGAGSCRREASDGRSESSSLSWAPPSETSPAPVHTKSMA